MTHQSEVRYGKSLGGGNPDERIRHQGPSNQFEVWRTARAPDLKPAKAFERFAVEQILKDIDLSDEEIESGDFGVGDDGGVDGMYLLINRSLILEETTPPDPAITVELVMIQAKNETGFTETAGQKLQSFAQDLLDYQKDPAKISYLNSKARDGISLFRNKYNLVMGQPHTLTISFHYATRSDGIPGPNDKVSKRVDGLKAFVRSRLSAADVKFTFWGSVKLFEAARSNPKQDEVIKITKHLAPMMGR